MKRRIIVSPNGDVSFVHDDLTTAAMRTIGTVEIARASHVEPTDDGRWTADMAPSGGPVLGSFDDRADALAAERQWLRDNRGL